MLDRRGTDRPGARLPPTPLIVNKLRIATAIVVIVIWATGYIIAFYDRTFTPPPEVSGIMLAVVTWLFGSTLRDAAKKVISGKDKENGS